MFHLLDNLLLNKSSTKCQKLNIVTLNGSVKILKEIIREMTRVNPEERLSAVEVLDHLGMESVTADCEVRIYKTLFSIHIFNFIGPTLNGNTIVIEYFR